MAVLVWSATLVAVTVAEVVLETVGAVNFPNSVMLPVVVDQVTDVLLVPLTNALNCSLPADDTLELVGDTEIPTLPVEDPFTVRLNVFSKRLARESITSTRTLKEPVAVGVPEIVPAELRVKPAGIAQRTFENRYGP